MYTRTFAAALVIAACAAPSLASAAVTPHDLEVRGTLRTPACTVTAEDGGEYDFKRINTAVIPGAGHLALGEVSKHWTVDCKDARTFMVFRVLDNRASSASSAGDNNFGLGNVNKTGMLGYYTVEMREPQVDGAAAHTLRVGSGAADGVGEATTLLNKTQAHGWTDGAGGGRVPVAGSTFSSVLAVKAYLANSTLMNGPLTDKATLDGHLTLSYSFGL